MDLYLVFHSVVMHLAAAMILFIYIPLSMPVRLFIRAFVKPFRKEDLGGKIVLITGASSGIGEELAYQYAKEGARLALVARRKQALEGVAVAARERGSPDVLVLVADVSDADESRRAVEATITHFGRLDHLVANAGIGSAVFFDKVTNIAAFTKVMDVNFWGSVYPTYYALPHLRASKGKLIACTSIAGTVPLPSASIYNASKAAQIRFYETLRIEFGSDIGITILAPGLVESEITKGKLILKDGETAIDEEARDDFVSVFPVCRTETFCEAALDSIRKGDWYMTWPSMCRPLQLVACLAPEAVYWIGYKLYVARDGKNRSLGKRIVDATGARRMYPSSLLRPAIKTEKRHGQDSGKND